MRKAIRYYYIVTLLSILLYMPFPELSCMFRINSSFFVFLFVVAEFESGIILFAADLWAFIFFGLFITGIVLAEAEKYYYLITIISGIDLLISSFILLYRPHATYIEWPMFVGFLLHSLHYAFIVVCVCRERIGTRTKRNAT